MARIKAVLFTSRQYKDGTHPVMIRVSHRRKLKYFPMKISVLKDHWDEMENLLDVKVKNFSQLYKRKNIEIRKCLLKLMEIVNDLEALNHLYTVEDIEQRYNVGSGALFNVYANNLIQELESINKMGNASAYRSASSALIRFMGKESISFEEIDYTLIKQFETHMIFNGMKTNGISCYMRTIRAIYNRAIKEGFAKRENYPFLHYKVKSEKTQKRALTKEQIIQIRDLDLSSDPGKEQARDLFIFSFYCMGISFVDIAHLKVLNVFNERINYSRQKTSQKYTIALVAPALKIIEKYSDLKNPSDYVFPLLEQNHAEMHKLYAARATRNRTKLKQVGKILELPITLTPYVARHSWATIAKRSGIPTAIISEGLGHTTERTTQIYLDSFENEVLDAANRLITL
ncbi:site-specific recombinase XerD [Ancylomarina subtilis]|uniref:Site-specific recombinase XerD n=1 Tax=Ancylomarina subtilis TaxID=1639035 RepID=A0A4Q7V4Z6_9BACT|nr:site-specific integrase [Ancylomarina subtilis]RZT91325.1 site-specific recombinase XerD [Ancylomarina subtilis]